ncbi:hypothetical protein [Paenibacillus pinistramenti]|uniref:hypothetical protein n=1 Tax=Paenibacillus pinistramenti TaxID=1768003 RepID=UPI0011091796|nr:hypothetical protein [Paenibacillus pinistramenti]
MSAFDEYDKERREIDELLFKGYRIEGIEETLDGALVKFRLKPQVPGTAGQPGPSEAPLVSPSAGLPASRSADPAADPFYLAEARLELPLLTADARKYVVSRYIEMMRSQAG